ncbi:MAG: hypothetical protein HY892_03045 [Deltaproteobacteria bacterium]|nr:hypothetical protein [Deltaproteobacteria bacterium]
MHWEEENGLLSTQVVQEFYVNITRKIPLSLTPAQARGFILNQLVCVARTQSPDKFWLFKRNYIILAHGG